MFGSFFDKFNNDLEIIYAKYSQSFDGDVELYLSSCKLPKHRKILENSKYSAHGHWHTIPRCESSQTDLSVPSTLSTSSDDGDGSICSGYSGDERSGCDWSPPIYSLVEGISSSCDSDDVQGWESDASGPVQRQKSVKNNNRSCLKLVKPPKSLAISEHLQKASLKKKSKKNRPRNAKTLPNSTNITAEQNPSNTELLIAIRQLRRKLTGFLGKSRSNSVKDLALMSRTTKKCSDEKHFERKYLTDQKKQILESWESRRPSREFVVEKLLVRRKGSNGGVVELASRQSLRCSTEHGGRRLRSPLDDRDLRSACGNLRSSLTSSSTTKSSSKRHGNYYNAFLLENPLMPIPKHQATSPNCETAVATRYSIPRRRSRVSSDGEDEGELFFSGTPLKNDRVSPHGSPGTDYRRLTQFQNQHPQSMLSSQNSGNSPTVDYKRRLFDSSPTSEYLKGKTLPGGDNCAIGRRSVPLKATPGSKSLRLSDISLEQCQLSTPKKYESSSARVKDTAVSSSPDRNSFLSNKRLLKPDATQNSLPTRNVTSQRDVLSSNRLSSTSKLIPRGPLIHKREEPKGSSHRSLPSREDLSESGERLVDSSLPSTTSRNSSPAADQTSSIGQISLVSGRTSVLSGQTSAFASEISLSSSQTPFSSSYNCILTEKSTNVDENEKTRKSSWVIRRQTKQANNHLARLSDISSSTSSRDSSPRKKTLKARSTPRRNSQTGFHPYAYSRVQRNSPSLSSPFQALSIGSPSDCDDTVRWSTLAKKSKRGRSKKNGTPSKDLVVSRKNLTRIFFKDTDDPDKIADTEVIQSCSPGNCTKRFCFNCSMDCS